MSFRFVACVAIAVSSALGADALALIDEPATPCVNDRLAHWDHSTVVAASDGMSSCRSEVLVLTRHRRLTIVERDGRKGPLKKRLHVPLNVWLARPNAEAHARNSISMADAVFKRSRVGVLFARSVRTRTLAAIEPIKDGCAGAPFEAGAYVAGQLNVYFVDDAVLRARGLNCSNDRNVIFIGKHDMDGVLAHELGHAFGLNGEGCRDSNGDRRCSPNYSGHPNDLPNFDAFGPENVMSLGSDGVQRFTLGQAIRMNLHAGSMLNVNGHRNGPTRDCPGDVVSAECPDLAWPDH